MNQPGFEPGSPGTKAARLTIEFHPIDQWSKNLNAIFRDMENTLEMITKRLRD